MLATVLAGNETVQLDGHTVPTYRFPESAVRALSHMASRSEWLQTEDRPMPDQLMDSVPVRTVVGDFLRGVPEGGWLDMPSAVALATAAGLPLVETAIVATSTMPSPRRAGWVSRRVEGAGASILHKTDLGAVNCRWPTSGVIALGSAMCDRFGDHLEGFVVQRMAPSGVELLAGVATDPAFGPLVIFGAGGTAAELLQGPRRAAGSAECRRPRADGPRAADLAAPRWISRAQRSIDHAPLEALLVRLGQLADSVPEIVEIDLNPIIATPDGLCTSSICGSAWSPTCRIPSCPCARLR